MSSRGNGYAGVLTHFAFEAEWLWDLVQSYHWSSSDLVQDVRQQLQLLLTAEIFIGYQAEREQLTASLFAWIWRPDTACLIFCARVSDISNAHSWKMRIRIGVIGQASRLSILYWLLNTDARTTNRDVMWIRIIRCSSHNCIHFYSSVNLDRRSYRAFHHQSSGRQRWLWI